MFAPLGLDDAAPRALQGARVYYGCFEGGTKRQTNNRRRTGDACVAPSPALSVSVFVPSTHTAWLSGLYFRVPHRNDGVHQAKNRPHGHTLFATAAARTFRCDFFAPLCLPVPCAETAHIVKSSAKGRIIITMCYSTGRALSHSLAKRWWWLDGCKWWRGAAWALRRSIFGRNVSHSRAFCGGCGCLMPQYLILVVCGYTQLHDHRVYIVYNVRVRQLQRAVC